MRYEYDNLKVQSSKYKTQLQNLNDELKICELEARRPNLDTNPLTRQIQTLENRYDIQSVYNFHFEHLFLISS